jgi:D-alanine-D-alanine ligase
MLDLYRMPYTGSGVGASAVAMDKIRCREALSQHGVPMARALTPAPRLTDRDAESVLPEVERTLGFPCFLKSDRSGSSIGVARAESRAEFLPALEQIRPHGERWLVEEALSGTELTVACLGNAGGEVQALPPVEIRPRHDRFFTYRAKYTSDESDEICPPRSVPPPIVEEAMDLGRTCHEALCCDGMSRTDMILTEDGAKVLEVNTIPGLTRMSLLPKAAAAAGISFARLVDRLIALALARAGREDLRAAS